MTVGELPFPRKGEGVFHEASKASGVIEEDHLGTVVIRLPDDSLINVNGYHQDEWIAPGRTLELQPSTGCGYAGC